VYYAFNQQVPARPLAQSFGTPNDICGHENGCAYGGDPINLATGNAVWQETDLLVPAPGLPFSWWRTYNSRDGRTGLLGSGWSLSYDTHLDLSTPSTSITATLEDGGQSVYVISGTQYLRPQTELAELQAVSGGYQLTRPDQSVLRFSTTGRLLSKADSAGRTLTLNYSGTTLNSLTDAVGRLYSLTTDAQGRITHLTDTTLSRSLTYTYTAGLLSDVQDLRGFISHYSYSSGLLTSVTAPDGVVRVVNNYDGLGRLTRQQAATAAPITVTYDISVPPITETLILTTGQSVTVSRAVTRTTTLDNAGNLTAYDHDAGNRVLRMVDATGQSVIYHLNGNDEFAQTTDALNRITNRDFDAHGNVLAVRDPTGVGPSYAYDALNHLVAQQDALGHTTAYTYTTGGLPQQVIDPLNQTTIYTYTVVPLAGGITMTLRTAERDPLGHTSSYSYNNLAQPVTITDSLLQATYMTYDGAGRLTVVTDTTGIAECRQYDAADHLTAQIRNCRPGQPATAAQNVETDYGYDLVGRATWTRNPIGEVMRTFYDNNGRVSQTVVGCALAGVPSTTTCDSFTTASPQLNRPINYGYDSLSRPVLVTDTLGVVTHTDYDSLSRPWRTVANYQPAVAADASTNVTTTLQFDAAGQQIGTTDALGRQATQQYDPAGRVTDVTQNAVSGAPRSGDTNLVTHTAYNPTGQPVTVTVNYVDGVWDPSRPNEDLRQVTAYDALLRPITVTASYSIGVPGLDPSVDRITNYVYDAAGNVTALVDPLGRTQVSTYDGLNRAVSVTRNCTDGAGVPRLSNCAIGHGVAAAENITSTLSYTPRGELATQTDVLGRVSHSYYDALQRPITTTLNENGPAPANVSTYHTYDALGHSLVATNALGYTQTVSYNSAGWTTGQLDATSRGVTYSYDGMGRRIDQVDGNSHHTQTRYDTLGRVQVSVVNYQGLVMPPVPPDVNLTTQTRYDAVGRMLGVTYPDGHQTSYGLDGLDRLRSVTENAGGTVVPANVPTGYDYDRLGHLTVITNTRNYTQTRSYYNDPNKRNSETAKFKVGVPHGYDPQNL